MASNHRSLPISITLFALVALVPAARADWFFHPKGFGHGYEGAKGNEIDDNEKSFVVGKTKCRVTPTEFKRLDNPNSPGSQIILESREISCRFGAREVAVPLTCYPPHESYETRYFHISEDGKGGIGSPLLICGPKMRASGN